MTLPVDPDSLADLFLTTPTGASIPMRAATRRAKDLLCIDAEQRILLRNDGSAIAVVRYYRPAVIQADPEPYSLAVADNSPDEKRKRRFLVLSHGVFTLEPFPATGELIIPKNAWIKEQKGPGLGSWIACDDPVLAAEFERKLFGGTLE